MSWKSYLVGMPPASLPASDRVTERRRAVALARHYREAEGLSIAQIAHRLGRRRDGQGVLLRPDRREGAGGQGPLPACAAAAAPTRSRATARATPTRLQGLPSRRDPAALDPRAGAGCDAQEAGNWLVDLHFRNANPRMRRRPSTSGSLVQVSDRPGRLLRPGPPRTGLAGLPPHPGSSKP